MSDDRLAGRRVGENASLITQAYDGNDGSVVPLTGYSPGLMTASATHVVLMDVVPLNISLEDAANGVVRLSYGVNDFTEVGEYDVKFTVVNPANSEKETYPKFAGALILNIDV